MTKQTVDNIETLILSNLIYNDEYLRKVIPFLNKEYFKENIHKAIFREIESFVSDYNSPPSKEALLISLGNNNQLSQNEYDESVKYIESFDVTEQEIYWLLDQTEKFCRDKAIYNAIMESIHIMDGKVKDKQETAIPYILSDALAVSFDTHIGHDYIEDADDRYDFYHRTESKVPFDLDFFNTITGGGTPQKTLNIVMAGTGVGKSLFMCHHAASCLSQNLNVLYITCEMAEERIAERIDANLMDITMDELKELPKTIYESKLKKKTSGINGKLIIKEYPTATANVNHFKGLLDELKMKKKFMPDIIFIDYLNICSSARLKHGSNVNTYSFVKSIAEELRGLAVEYNVPIWSATQTNRSGFSNTDVGLEDTSESFGLPATADFMFALIATEELDEKNQVLVKQLKNRYNDTVINRKFILGINRAKMKLYDVDKDDQGVLSQANQTTEELSFGSGFGPQTKKEKSEQYSDWNI
ncbi:MAG: AAA family ATPase [Proteobacteria bacterium]|nr:AAA family ATPase [Pseudomonadota bacterium]